MAPPSSAQSARYLYERLGSTRFQQLCGALLASTLPGVTCYPVGQSDGGRDIVRKSDARSVVFQVKWTSKPEQDPVRWLDAAIKGEFNNIRRLIDNGAEEYYLLTSVGGTAVPARGSMDRLDALIAKYSKELGIPLRVWWRDDIDARVVSAPRELVWSFQEMLAGVEAVRYVIEADAQADRDQELRRMLLAVIATQWHSDAKVKFRQVELQSYDVVDLFVDVEATRTSYSGQSLRVPGAPRPRGPARRGALPPDNQPLGGAAAYLLSPDHPLTLIRGEPGQGKSTLGQYLCQIHRNHFLPASEYRAGRKPPTISIELARIPLRLDLRDYATWLSGADPFVDDDSDSENRTAHPRQARPDASLEVFLTAMLSAQSGGLTATAAQVADLLHRFPVLLVLDGLDEVADEHTRSKVVEQIDRFTARLGLSATTSTQVIVTTRPNASNLAEPSAETFETISLNRLDDRLRTAYLRKWCDVQALHGRERRELERTFRLRSAEPHILQLADNPMQLTILLYLMRRRGGSVPSQRTALYSSYMETFLDREASKTPAVDKYRADLEEVTSYLGWYLQARAETNASNGRVTTQLLRRAIGHYLVDGQKDVSLIDALFTTVTDRVWVLVSKIQGTFEFDIQPLREYFAARYLREFAGGGQDSFDSANVLQELIRRPYWLNTTRFFAGFARPNELAGLVEAIAAELDCTPRALQVRTALWTLLADGVFSGRPRSQLAAATLLGDDLSIRLMGNAVASTAEGLPRLAPDRGGAELAGILRDQMAKEPSSELNSERAVLLSQLAEPGDTWRWWRGQLSTSVGGPNQDHWMSLGAFPRAQKLEGTDLEALCLRDDRALARALAAGVVPLEGSELERRMLDAVYQGRCSSIIAPSWSLPGALLLLMAPRQHLRRANGGSQAYRLPVEIGSGDLGVKDQDLRTATRYLAGRDARFSVLQRALRFNKGQGGTTSPWSNSARVVASIYRPCWLAAETTVIGAVIGHDFTTGGDITPGSEPLGPRADYGRLLQSIRALRDDRDWWESAFETYPDDLSRATWGLALLAGAPASILLQNLDRLERIVADLGADDLQVLVDASGRLGASRLARSLNAEALTLASGASPVIKLMIAHHLETQRQMVDLPEFSDEDLIRLAAFGRSAWPALYTASCRTGSRSTGALPILAAFGAAARLNTRHMQVVEPETARVILASPNRYPLDWVIRAEQQDASRWSETALAEFAEAQGWFSPL